MPDSYWTLQKICEVGFTWWTQEWTCIHYEVVTYEGFNVRPPGRPLLSTVNARSGLYPQAPLAVGQNCDFLCPRNKTWRSSSGLTKKAELESYRKCISHLLLPIHRCNQSQVAYDASRGHTKYCDVVVKGNLHHRVFRLAREAFFLKEGGEMCYHGDVFFMCFSEVAAAGLRKRIKLHFQPPKSWHGNQHQSSGKRGGAVTWQRQIISAAVKALVMFREKHIHQSLIETRKN